VETPVSHFMQVPMRISMKLPHSRPQSVRGEGGDATHRLAYHARRPVLSFLQRSRRALKPKVEAPEIGNCTLRNLMRWSMHRQRINGF
jgi:hypothetical protein